MVCEYVLNSPGAFWPLRPHKLVPNYGTGNVGISYHGFNSIMND